MRKERNQQNQFFMCARLIDAFQEMRGRGGGYTLDSMTYAQLARGQSILTIATLQTARLCGPNMKPTVTYGPIATLTRSYPVYKTRNKINVGSLDERLA